MATGKLIPTDRRQEGSTVWYTVNDYPVTQFTLLNQRLYHQHQDGSWSLPKSEDSIISIGENW